MSSTIRCSQCHQVGHNRRNVLCPINVQRTQPVVVPVVVTPQANEPTTPPPPQETPLVGVFFTASPLARQKLNYFLFPPGLQQINN